MRRLQRPLNPQAVAAANKAIEAETGGRSLEKGPQDAELRKKWTDAYIQAGGKVAESPNSRPVKSSQQPCPNKKWIELRYLHCDEEPVEGATFHIRAVGYSKDGVINKEGFIRVDGVPDTVEDFQYWFDKDQEKYKPKDSQVSSSTGAPEASSTLAQVGDWIWGTVQGDFNEKQSISQMAVNTLLGFIPLVDQALDIRDIIAGLKNIVVYYSEDSYDQKSQEEVLGLSYEMWLWVNVFIIALGAIPILGSAIKGVLKALLHYLQDTGKAATKLSPVQLRYIWEQLLKVLNHFAIDQGNANRWLKELPGKLGGLMDEAALKIKSALGSLRTMINKSEEYARRLSGTVISSHQAEQITDLAKKYKKGLTKAYNSLDDMKVRVNKWFGEQIKAVLGGSHQIENSGSVLTKAEKNGPNVHIQEEVLPPTGDIKVRPPVRVLSVVPSSGQRIVANPDKTTTILGRFKNELEKIKPLMGENDFNVGSAYGIVSENKGGFNFLNIPKKEADEVGDDFFKIYNEPWLDQAISRGDDIILATIPSDKFAIISSRDGSLLGTYPKELEYLIGKDYKPVNVSSEKWEEIKGYFKEPRLP